MKTISRLVAERIPMAMLAAGLAGCVSPPVPERATAPWPPPPDAQRADTVWSDLRKQAVYGSTPLALGDLADIALRNNPATRQTWNAARAAAEQVRQAEGYFMPELDATAGANRQFMRAEPSSFDTDFLKSSAGLQVNYLILNMGGGRRAAVEQALQTVYAADFSFNASIQDVLLAVETAYYGAISAEAAVAAAASAVKDAESTLRAAKDRKAAGMGTELDVLQAQAGYDQALYGMAGAKGQLRTAQGGLSQVLGLPADIELRLAASTVELPDAAEARTIRTLIDEAMRRRPDVAALRSAWAASEAAVKVADAALWPSLFFNGAVSRDFYTRWSGQPAQDRDWSYGAGLSLQWTLFDGMRNTSAQRIAEDRAAEALAHLRQAELAAGADVWTRYHAFQTASQKYAFASAFLRSASASYGLALDSYKSGLRSILDLLNAESQLAQARSQKIAARQDAFTALAALARATGVLEKGGSAEARDLFATPTQKEPKP